MRARYLFEFCDQKWVPAGARECLFEIMEACNTGLRSFNGQVGDAVIEIAREEGLDTIVELGAGRAPVITRLAEDQRAKDFTLIPCDLVPNEPVFRELAARYGGRVQPIFTSVDITQEQAILDSSVLVLAGVMHHIPFELRPAVLQALSESSSRIAVFEPLKRTFLSMFLASLSLVPALLLPITFMNRPGRLRRCFWCWILPIVPPMFAWDGVTSCLRQWTESEWRQQFDRLHSSAHDVEIHTKINSLRMIWSGRRLRGDCPSSSP